MLMNVVLPVLRPAAVLTGRTSEFQDFGHVPTHFVLDDFKQRDIRSPEAFGIGQQRPVSVAVTAIELANPAGDQVHEDVGIEDFCQGLFEQFGVHVSG